MRAKFFILPIIVLIISLCLYVTSLTNINKTPTQQSILTPEQTIDTAFKALKNGTPEDFNKFINYKTEHHGIFVVADNKLFGNNLNKKSKELLTNLFSQLSYNIKDVKINENTATAKVQIINRDFSNTSKEILYYHNSKNPLMEAIRNNDSNMTTIDLQIVLNKTNGIWKIEMDSSLANALCGGLI